MSCDDAFGKLLFSQAVDQLQDVFLVFTADGALRHWNRRTCEITGFTDQEIGRMRPYDLVPDEEGELIARQIETVLSEGHARFEAHLRTRQARRIPCEFTGSRLQHGSDQLVCAVGRDSTEQVQIDRIERKNILIRLMEEVARASNQAEHFEEALQTAVDAVCARTGWPVGHVYVPADDRSGTLVPTAIWSMPSGDRFDSFRAITEETSFVTGEGLPGRVLGSGEPAWIPDVTRDVNFPRAKLAEDIGVKGAFAFPVPVGDEVVAVLEFFSEEVETPDAEVLDAMASVGVQLGRVAEREQVRQQLEASEKKYRAVTETAVDGIVVAGSDGNITDWNEGAREIFGYRAEEVVGQPIEILMPGRYRQRHRDGMERVNRTGEGKFLGQTIQLEGLRKSGEEFPLELSLSSWTAGGRRFFSSIIRDITDRKEIERELRESEEKFRILAERSLVGIVLIQDDRYTYVNPRFAEIFGYERKDLIGRPPEWIAHPEDKPRVRENVRRRLEGEVETLRYTFRGQSRQGQTVYVDVYGTRMIYRGRPAIVGSVLDITEKRQMEREILQIQEAERRRIGQELHDGVASQLTGITMLSEALVQNLKEGQTVAPEQLEEVIQLIRDTNEQTRRLSRGLNPVEVGAEGLPVALENLSTRCEKRSDLSCWTEVNGEVPQLDQQTATHLYRIAQEAMNNAIRHAEASRIWIEMSIQNGHLTLSINDDGKGMPGAGPSDAPEGIGLRTMRYRADLIGGQLEISNRSEGGTRVMCSIHL